MSHRKMSKALIVTSLSGILLFTSACSGDNEPAVSPSAGPSATASAVATATPTAEPVAEPAAGEGFGPTIEGLPTMKEPATDKNGVWRKTAILPDDPAYKIPDSVIMEPNVKEMWSEAEIQEVHRLTVDMAVDMIDTPANGALSDTESMEKWWEVNKDKFDPLYAEELKTDALSTDVNKPLVYKVAHRQHTDPALDYGLVYGEDKVHVKNREISTYEILAGELSGRKAIAVTLQVNFSNIVEVDGKENTENAAGNMRYTFVKDETTGKFLITGYNSTFTTQPIR